MGISKRKRKRSKRKVIKEINAVNKIPCTELATEVVFHRFVNDYLNTHPNEENVLNFFRAVLRETNKRLDIKVIRKVFFNHIQVPTPPPPPNNSILRTALSQASKDNLQSSINEKRLALKKTEPLNVHKDKLLCDDFTIALMKQRNGNLLKKVNIAKVQKERDEHRKKNEGNWDKHLRYIQSGVKLKRVDIGTGDNSPKSKKDGCIIC